MRKVTAALVALYAFSVPWDQIVLVPGIGTLTRAVGIVVIGAAALTIVLEGRFRKPDIVLGMAGLFTGFGALSLLWTVSYPATFQAVYQYAQLLASVWFIREFARTQEQQQRLLVAFCLGTFVPLIDLMNQFRTGTLATATRYAATGFTADGVALLLVVGIPVAWHLTRTHKGPVRVVAMTYFGLAPVAVLLTATRAAFLGGVVALSIVPLSLAKESLRAFLRVATLVVLITATLASFVPSSAWTRIMSIPNELAGGSMSTRRDIWDAGLRVLPQHPMLGVGVGAYGEAVGSLRENSRASSTVAHNVIIGVLVEQGVVGLLLFAALLAACARVIVKLPSEDRKFWAVTMLTWSVGLMSISIERWKVTWVLFGLLAAQNGSLLGRRRRSEPLVSKDPRMAATLVHRPSEPDPVPRRRAS